MLSHRLRSLEAAMIDHSPPRRTLTATMIDHTFRHQERHRKIRGREVRSTTAPHGQHSYEETPNASNRILRVCVLTILILATVLTREATSASQSKTSILPYSETRPPTHRLNGRTPDVETPTFEPENAPSGDFFCPIAECKKQYTTARGLGCHIRKSADPDHRLIQTMSALAAISECPVCRSRFYNKQTSVVHLQRSFVNGYGTVHLGPNLTPDQTIQLPMPMQRQKAPPQQRNL